MIQRILRNPYTNLILTVTEIALGVYVLISMK